MGIFDNIQQTKTTHFEAVDERTAWMSCMIACCRFDGDVCSSNIQKLNSLCKLCEVFYGRDIVNLFGSCAINHKNYGPYVLIDQSIKFINQDDYPTLFAFCADLAFSDGVINDERKKILEYLSDKCAVHPNTAKMIVEVLMIKNKRNVLLYVP